MKVNIINHSDSFGGASRVAFRIHKSFLNIDVNSTIIVNLKNFVQIMKKRLILISGYGKEK